MTSVNILHIANLKLPFEKNRLLMFFVGINIMFTGIDVALAHSINQFIPIYEWIPILFFPFGTLSCLLIAFQTKPKIWQLIIHILFMIIGIIVGITGTAFHANAVLNPQGYLTWAWVVFGSPILAPLAFSGISLLGLYAITEEDKDNPETLIVPGIGKFKSPISRDRHFLWLVGLGLAASAITSIIDHAQYGYSFYKLIPIIFGLFSSSVVIYLSISKEWSRGDEVVYFWTMVAAVAVGIMGFGFHLSADLAGTGSFSMERILAFAPIFAPMLYSDLGILGLLVVAKKDENKISSVL